MNLEANHYFMPVAVESLGAFGPEAPLFFRDLSCQPTPATGEPLAHHHLQQRIAVTMQRENTADTLGSFSDARVVKLVFPPN